MIFTHTEAFFLGKISPPRQKSLCTCLYHYMCYSQSSLLSYLHIFATILESEGVNLSVYLTLCDPMDCSLPVSSVHEIFKARILEWVFLYPRDLPNPGIKLRSPTLQVDILPAEPPGKPQNTGVGSLSLLMSAALQVNS